MKMKTDGWIVVIPAVAPVLVATIVAFDFAVFIVARGSRGITSSCGVAPAGMTAALQGVVTRHGRVAKSAWLCDLIDMPRMASFRA
jgi:hypothetical protein